MRLFLILLLASVAAATPALAQSRAAQGAADTDQPTFRTDVAVVRVDVQVRGRDGHTVPNLTKEDFAVTDAARPQQIQYFAHDTEPLDLLLLLDISGSMHQFLKQLAATADSALRNLHAGDRAGIMCFARHSGVHQELTADLAAVGSAMATATRHDELGSGTNINNAVKDAANYMKNKGRASRRAILIVTDNNGINYHIPDEEVIRALLDADSVLDGIIVGKLKRSPIEKYAIQHPNPDFSFADVTHLAGASGGETRTVAKADELNAMIENIRSRYSLHYAAPASQPGQFHEISVQLMPQSRARYKDATVQARSGYYAK